MCYNPGECMRVLLNSIASFPGSDSSAGFRDKRTSPITLVLLSDAIFLSNKANFCQKCCLDTPVCLLVFGADRSRTAGVKNDLMFVLIRCKSVLRILFAFIVISLHFFLS